MSTLEWEEEEWPNESFYDYLNRCMEYQRCMNPIKKRRAAFTILKKNRISQSIKDGGILDDITTWDDLNLLRGTINTSAYLANKIDRTSTEIGQVTLMALLVEPLETKDELEHRQSLIKELVNNESFFYKLEKQITLL